MEEITAEKALDSLEICVQNLYKTLASRRKTAEYLTELGYEVCDDGGNTDADRVKNVLCQEVINRCFAKRVDLTTKRPDKQGLKELLCVSLPTKRCVLTCPLDFFRNGIRYTATSQTSLKKLIECQFQLKWATCNGWPTDFSYYDFCKVVSQRWTGKNMSKMVLKNRVRNAQVKVQLYNCYMSRTNNEFVVEDLCPTVYIRTGKKRWQSLDKDLKKVALEGEGVNNFKWISEPIRTYILNEAETIPEAELGDERLTERLTKHTLYWAVVEDSHFHAAGEKLRLNEIGKTQVYVGKANKGIKNRWLTSPSSHCHNMNKCLSVFREVKTYNAELLSDVQLVDAVLLLEKLKRPEHAKSALFLMQTFAGGKELRNAEKRNIDGRRSPKKHLNIIPSSELDLRPRWKPIDMAYGMNVNR